MNMPGFTAEASLGNARGHYHTQISVGSISRGTVQPQFTSCFCSEPDTREVCTSSGRCYEKQVCLQMFCSGVGSEIDEDGFGELGVTVHYPN